jgi:hypothetical protein
VVADQHLDARALEADRVEHAARRLGDPDRRRPHSRFQEDALGDDPAHFRAVQQGHVGAVRERAAGGEHRRPQLDAAHVAPQAVHPTTSHA